MVSIDIKIRLKQAKKGHDIKVAPIVTSGFLHKVILDGAII